MIDVLNWCGDHPILAIVLTYMLVEGVGSTIIYTARALRRRD